MYHSAMEPRPVSCSSFVPLLRRMSYLILKRGFDLVFSLVLLVTCALLMAVIALVVWLDSPGKIIYTQIRLGYGGKPFTIYKFRSMQQSTAPDDAKWTSENDTRITRRWPYPAPDPPGRTAAAAQHLYGRNELCWPTPRTPHCL